ncbi:hypothetical protein CI238_05061 [Colletotrichum incanum]|uniref:Uncharacterized protein n=1 Tax=Colletotrichum incanum TaxID=1573173 RepID=A0A162Q248_COLIC|nr:hypothetical protein CI238_05061 [Colletotrichum incanum]OHX01103.1 hypothetical protein CSPAE12_00151 [Colletotrichum incanum]
MPSPKDDGLPTQPNTRKEISPQPPNHILPTTAYSKPLPTSTGDNVPSEVINFAESGGLSTQAPETSKEHDYRDVPPDMPSSPPSVGASYNDAKSRSAPESIENQYDCAKNTGVADSHRKSKTEFNSIPAEIVLVGLDMVRGPETGSQTHRKWSTEFNKTMAAGKCSSLHVFPRPRR